MSDGHEKNAEFAWDKLEKAMVLLREKDEALAQSEEGFAAARLTIARLVGEKIALEALADAAEAEYRSLAERVRAEDVKLREQHAEALAAEKARADDEHERAEMFQRDARRCDEALAAARREVEGLRGALQADVKSILPRLASYIDQLSQREQVVVSCIGSVSDIVARAALAAPADGEEKSNG